MAAAFVAFAPAVIAQTIVPAPAFNAERSSTLPRDDVASRKWGF